MKEIIGWLMAMEERAMSLYDRAAAYYCQESDMAEFFRRLSAQEKEHLAAMKKADSLHAVSLDPGLLRFDAVPREAIEAGLGICEQGIAKGTITKMEFLECMVEAEFSEWNSIFLYVVRALGQEDAELKGFARKMQVHKKAIEAFLSGKSELAELLARIQRLPDVEPLRILVVDDVEVIRDFLHELLSEAGMVDTASNGEEALGMMEEGYYHAIISDVDMPKMDGLEMYRRASEKYPGIRQRMVFFTAANDFGTIHFFKENDLGYLRKPASISEIREAVARILERQ